MSAVEWAERRGGGPGGKAPPTAGGSLRLPLGALSAWMVIALVTKGVTGTCLEKDITYQNGTSWTPDPCVTCTCQSPLVVCERTTCLDPGCRFNEGQTLQIREGQCCPVCAERQRSCQHLGTTHEHQTTWNPVPCEQCTCTDGRVTCVQVRCSNLTCPPGHLQHTAPDQCCPTCMAVGGTCLYLGEEREAGSSWQPSPCVRCRCDDGDVSCFTMTCPDLTCPRGSRLLTLPGHCCPECVAPPCVHHGNIYQAGSRWQADRCTWCGCDDQRVTCHRRTCHSQSSCHQGMTQIWKDDLCCPLCIEMGSACESDDGRRYHTELWSPSPCERCVCRHGVVSCSPVTCPTTTCTGSEVKLTSPGSCCPACAKKRSCRVSHGVFKHGSEWTPSPCELCECDDGRTVCFTQPCPHCPPGERHQPVHGLCCGPCVPVGCSSSCSDCLPSDPRHCTRCADPRRHLQDGRCVTRCTEGYYHHGHRCVVCSADCATCGGPTNHHCLTCPGGATWEQGRCVKACSAGHVLHKGICHECPNGCYQCLTTEVCLGCKAEFTLRAGRCVPRCAHIAQWDEASRQCRVNRGRPHLEVTGDLTGHSGELTPLTEDLLRVTDQDSLLGHLTYHVVRQPTNGVLVSVSGGQDVALRHGVSFTYSQLRGGYVYYKHNRHKPLHDSFQLSVSDGDLSSHPQTVDVRLTSRTPPFVRRNRLLIVVQGGKAVLSPTDNLSVGDDDSPGAVTVTVVQGPSAGRLLRADEAGPVTAFSLTDLRAEQLVYVHQLSPNQHEELTAVSHDQMTLQVSDGNHAFLILFNIKIIPQGRQTPVVVNNSPLYVDGGHEAPVTQDVLLSVHPTAPPTRIVYTMRPAHSTKQAHGSFLMVVRMPPAGPSQGWRRHGDDKMAAEMNRFRQSDVDKGRIWFKVNAHSDKVLSYNFDVCDLSRPPHCLTSQTFTVRPTPPLQDEAQDGPGFTPNLVFVPDENSRLGTTVFDNKVTVLAADDLGIYVPNSEPEDVQYRVTSALSAGEGTIEHVRRPLMPVHLFTLADLVAESIVYRPPPAGIGPASKEVTFKFIVVGRETGQELPEQAFTLTVVPVTTSPPAVGDSSPVLRVAAGGIVPIGVGVVSVTDADTPLHELLVVLEKAPRAGQLLKVDLDTRVVLREGDQFSFSELQSGSLFYEHDGSRPADSDDGLRPAGDGFYLVVTDGDHSVDVHVRLEVTKVDRSAPQPHPAASMSLTLPEGTVKQILREHLAFSDSDSSDEELVIVLVTEPFHGRFVLGGSGEKTGTVGTGTSFTQGDINDGRVRFEAEKEIGPESRVDTVYMNVTDAGGNMLPVQLFTVTTTPINNQSPQLSLGKTILVEEGGRVPLTVDDLSVNDPDTHPRLLRVVIDSPPVYGVFENVRPAPGSEVRGSEGAVPAFTVEDLLQGHVHYVQTRHQGVEPEADGALLHVEDGLNTSPVGCLNVTVMPRNDEPPVVSVQPLQCTEGGSVDVTNTYLSVRDLDTSTADLTLTLEEQPQQGNLRKKTVRNEAPFTALQLKIGTVFKYQDVLDGLIVYTHREPSEGASTDQLVVRVTDGAFSTVGVVPVNISARDEETPRVVVNRGLRVPPGSITTLTPLDLQASDIDSDDLRLTFTITRAPALGKWLLAPRLQAAPGNSNVLEEQTQHSGPAQVLPQGRRQRRGLPPQGGLVSADPGRVVGRGHSKGEGHWREPRRDAGVLPPELAGPVLGGLPAEAVGPRWAGPPGAPGVGHANGGSSPDSPWEVGPADWTQPDGHVEISPIGPVSSFTQEDINEGLVLFAHSPEEASGLSVTDFTVTDPEGNMLLDQTFIIDIVDDRVPPSVTVNKELEVKEGSEARLTTEYLSASDSEADSRTLRFMILEPPRLGHIAMVTNKEVPLAEFSQADLAAGRVVYIHTSVEETRSDRLTFALSDGPNQVIRTFFIAVSSVDNKLPVVTNRGLRLQEGQTKVISEFELLVTDDDTEEEDLKITVTRPPQHGRLTVHRRGDLPPSADSFSMLDLYEGLVSYSHDGSEAPRDTFMFTVTDGASDVFLVGGETEPTAEDQEFVITIVPIDDGSPVLTVNRGLQFLSYRDAQSTNMISSSDLHSADKDTPPDRLTYRVTSGPHQGYVEHMDDPGSATFSFTQDDVDKGKIRYVLTKNTSALHDELTFDLEDTRHNQLPGNTFHVQWSVIEFGQVLYNVSETVGELHIPVKRHGLTKQYSVVTCQTIPDTATTHDGTRARRDKNDFKPVNYQIQFEGYEETKVCKVPVEDDSVFEGQETFFVQLSHPEFSLLGEAVRTTVIINDDEDEPVIQFEHGDLEVEEGAGVVRVSLLRTGDLSAMASVLCTTRALTARGSTGRGLQSGSDYQSRLPTAGSDSRVMFAAGAARAYCDVRIIDDSEFEASEAFELVLTDPSMMTRLGTRNRLMVTIVGPNDESTMYMVSAEYTVAESAGRVAVGVGRAGPDLDRPAAVWCGARPSEQLTALPGEDFIPCRERLVFQPGEISQVCWVTLVDDVADPHVEGPETFEVYLYGPEGAHLGQPQVSLVIINDTEDDVAVMQFASPDVTVSESAGQVVLPVLRTGDVSYHTSVICFTRQQGARVMDDFTERPWTDASRITFPPGVKVVNCTVDLVEDDVFEGEEQFVVRLADPLGFEQCGARVGAVDHVTVTITDPLDVPVVEFEAASYQTTEPRSALEVGRVTVSVVRAGDVQRVVQARYGTRDGSAVSGVDYTARSEVLTFMPGVRRVSFTIEILHNPAVEWQEAFSVVLGPQDPTNAMFGDVKVTTITIHDQRVAAGVVFPAPPVVASLLDYDDAASATSTPSAGYPLVCVTACDPKHPSFSVTGPLCQASGINRSAYQWEVAVPSAALTDPFLQHMAPPFSPITDHVPFAPSDSHVLDTVYFRPHYTVRCVARPLVGEEEHEGAGGAPSASKGVVIGAENGLCQPVGRGFGTDGLHGQSFMAHLEYIPPEDPDHPNTVHVSVRVPHQDGLLPLVSTHPLHNLRFLLTTPTYQQQHACSNFVPCRNPSNRPCFMETGLGPGPLGSNPAGSDPLPYQFDPQVRGAPAVGFYRHLNLRTCTWQFDAYLHLSELVNQCGGRVMSDFEVYDKALSHLNLHLPLYVSYVYTAGPGHWAALDHRTELQLSIMYDTMAWRAGLGEGVGLGEQDLTGDLQIIKISTNPQGNLLVDFKTQTNFRGCFVPSHLARPDWTSRLLAPVDLPLTFTLQEVWSQRSFDAPVQQWRAQSDLSLQDFSGLYTLELVPCTVPPREPYPEDGRVTAVCTPLTPRRFPVSLTYQQTLRPEPATYALATDFHVTSHVDEFLLHPKETNNVMGFDGVFNMGDRLYGRVLWSPAQDLEDAYRLQLEKVFVCTGLEGYVPTYDPTGEVYGTGPQYGCLHPTPRLKHRYLVLDRGDPDHVVRAVQGLPFEAGFASDIPEYAPLRAMPGVDGFVMNIDPLYKVDSGHVWYLQVLYVIKAATRGRHRRSGPPELFGLLSEGPAPLMSHTNRVKRQDHNKHQSEPVKGKKTQNGTDLTILRLKRQIISHNQAEQNTSSSSKTTSSSTVTIVVLAVVIAILILTVLSFLIYWRRTKRKRSRSQSQEGSSTQKMDLQVSVGSSGARTHSVETSVLPRTGSCSTSSSGPGPAPSSQIPPGDTLKTAAEPVLV